MLKAFLNLKLFRAFKKQLQKHINFSTFWKLSEEFSKLANFCKAF